MSIGTWGLAYLAYEGRLPRARVVEGDLRERRLAGREMRSVIQERSDLKRRFRSPLAQLGRTLTKTAWVSQRGRRQLEEWVTELESTAGLRGTALRRLARRIDQLDQEAEYWRETMDERAGRFPLVAQLDEQLPGIGPVLAPVIVSELGDPREYHGAAAYAKATGLTPGYRDSGGRRSGQAITRAGSWHVRWALLLRRANTEHTHLEWMREIPLWPSQDVQSLPVGVITRAGLSCMRCRRGPGLSVRPWVEHRRRRGKPLKPAMVAAARKLAASIWRRVNLGGEPG